MYIEHKTSRQAEPVEIRVNVDSNTIQSQNSITLAGVCIRSTQRRLGSTWRSQDIERVSRMMILMH